MRVRIKRDYMFHGRKPRVLVGGQILDLPDDDARDLIGRGLAEKEVADDASRETPTPGGDPLPG